MSKREEIFRILPERLKSVIGKRNLDFDQVTEICILQFCIGKYKSA